MIRLRVGITTGGCMGKVCPLHDRRAPLRRYGAWFAYVNAADPDHPHVRRILDQPAGPLVTSTYVFDETVTLTPARLGHRRAVAVGRTLLDPNIVELLSVTPADERAAWALFERRPDKLYSFTDCTSFVLMKRAGITAAVTLDEHFAQEGFAVIPPKASGRCERAAASLTNTSSLPFRRMHAGGRDLIHSCRGKEPFGRGCGR